MNLEDRIKAVIRDVKDYPKAGIIFKDITPLLANPSLVKEIVEEQVNFWRPQKIDAVACVEARGFIFGALIAQGLQCAFIPVRKSGKLPYKTISREYALEYGTSAVEMHVDAIQKGARVIIHDDLLATGGTSGAAADLIKSLQGDLAGFSFLINLSFLPGASNLERIYGVKPHYIVKY